MEVCRPPSRGGVGSASYTPLASPLGTPRPGSRTGSAARPASRAGGFEAWAISPNPGPCLPLDIAAKVASPVAKRPSRPGSRVGRDRETLTPTPTPRPGSRAAAAAAPEPASGPVATEKYLPATSTVAAAAAVAGPGVPASVLDLGVGAGDSPERRAGPGSIALQRPDTPKDGGKVDHRLAEAALERRGNAAQRADLADQTRMFDAKESRSWDKKYKYFSQEHMKSTYNAFARAKHDPFNKDPSWGKSILAGVSENCDKKGLTPGDLFQNIDLTGDGLLNRAEMKRVLVSVQPTLSDLELAAIFDVIDNDNSGEVSINEFCTALDKGRQVGHSADKTGARYRNPVHRVKRMPPAKVDGFDHIDPPCLYLTEEEACEEAQRSMMQRLWPLVAQTPRVDLDKRVHRYQYFGGGGDASRFRRTYRAMKRWQEAHPEAAAAWEAKTQDGPGNLAFVWDKKARCKKYQDPLR